MMSSSHLKNDPRFQALAEEIKKKQQAVATEARG
jgi:hypothetical protein